jgi:hypothetical protein
VLPAELRMELTLCKAYFNGSIPLPENNLIFLDDTRYESRTGAFFIITMVVDGTPPAFELPRPQLQHRTWHMFLRTSH